RRGALGLNRLLMQSLLLVFEGSTHRAFSLCPGAAVRQDGVRDSTLKWVSVCLSRLFASCNMLRPGAFIWRSQDWKV
ncbi:MAG: hypothetical protein M0Q87_13415, partial [Ottowia sp.]|nr:hypothetical protein [Ottowia sp.]